MTPPTKSPCHFFLCVCLCVGGAWRYNYGYTNIEYTEFGRLGMSDLPTEHGATTSKFPANTNVLYVNLHSALRVVEQVCACV